MFHNETINFKMIEWRVGTPSETATTFRESQKNIIT